MESFKSMCTSFQSFQDDDAVFSVNSSNNYEIAPGPVVFQLDRLVTGIGKYDENPSKLYLERTRQDVWFRGHSGVKGLFKLEKVGLGRQTMFRVERLWV